MVSEPPVGVVTTNCVVCRLADVVVTVKPWQVVAMLTDAGTSFGGGGGPLQSPVKPSALDDTFWLPGVVFPLTVSGLCAAGSGAGVVKVVFAPGARVVEPGAAPLE